MAIVISGNGIDMGGNPVSNASQIDGVVINENNENVATTSNLVGFKNYIINGNFDIAQRGETHTINYATSGVYHLDRWCSTQNGYGGVQSVQKVNTTVNGANDVALRTYQVTPCNNKIIQILDTASSKSLRGKRMSVSFWYRAKGEITCILQQRTDRQTLSSDFATQLPEHIGTAIGVSSGLIADETWRYASFTTTISSANGFFHLVFNQSIAVDNYYEITKVQLEEGSIATPFEQRPYGLELSLCQRYYETSGGVFHWATYTPEIYSMNPIITYNTTKRVVASVSVSEQSGTLGIQIVGNTVNGFDFRNENSNIGGGADKYVSWTASAEL